MANNQAFKIKNGLSAKRYLQNSTAVSASDVDLSTGSYFTKTLSANTTFTFSNPPASGKAMGFALEVTGANVIGPPDLSVASYDSVSFSVSSQTANPNGVFFGDSGTKMYVAADGPDGVFQYNLSTAYDLSTASYSNNYLNTSTYDGGTKCAAISHDGYEVFVPGEQGDDINQFTLSTAWDLSTASYTRTVSHSTQGTNAMAIQFNDDGTIMYLGLETTRGVYQYTLSTAYDISTMSYASKFYSLTQVEGMQISPDGTKLFNCGLDSIIQSHTLSTAWDVSTASSDSITFNVNSQDVDSTGLFFKPDKTKLYVCGKGNDAIYQYDVTSSATATVAWPSSVKWSGATAPDAPASGEKDVYVFVTTDGGTTYYGKQAGDAVA